MLAPNTDAMLDDPPVIIGHQQAVIIDTLAPVCIPALFDTGAAISHLATDYEIIEEKGFESIRIIGFDPEILLPIVKYQKSHFFTGSISEHPVVLLEFTMGPYKFSDLTSLSKDNVPSQALTIGKDVAQRMNFAISPRADLGKSVGVSHCIMQMGKYLLKKKIDQLTAPSQSSDEK